MNVVFFSRFMGFKSSISVMCFPTSVALNLLLHNSGVI